MSDGAVPISEWKNVVRSLHTAGGLRVICNPGPTAHVVPKPLTGAGVIQLESYVDNIRQARRAGFEIIGCDFFTDEEQLRGLRESDWRPLLQPIGQMTWPAFEVQQLWKNIANGAARQNNMPVFEKARHIGTQLKICNWRLKDLSDSYHRHLLAVTTAGNFKTGTRYSGRFSQNIFYSAHAMFSELGSLRDHLSMFVGGELLGISRSKVDNWAKLVEERNFERSRHPAAQAMKDAKAWVELFSQYRNLFMHNAPLSEANGVILVSHLAQDIEIGTIPTVALQLPSDPKALRERLRRGQTSKSFDDWLATIHDRSTWGPDALSYCYGALREFLLLANLIAAHSPVQPEKFTITDNDIIGEMKAETKVVPPLSIPIPRSR